VDQVYGLSGFWRGNDQRVILSGGTVATVLYLVGNSRL
jgi:hypothetical protein